MSKFIRESLSKYKAAFQYFIQQLQFIYLYSAANIHYLELLVLLYLNINYHFIVVM